MKCISLPEAKPSAIARYGYAIATVVVSFLIPFFMDETHRGSVFFGLFLFTVIFTSWFGGLGPGLIATEFSVLAISFYFLPPLYSPDQWQGQMFQLIFLSLAGIFIAVVNAAPNRSEKYFGSVFHNGEESFRAFVENASDHIIRYDREFRRTYVNPAVANAYGLPRESFIGTVVGSVAKQIGMEGFEEKIKTVKERIQSVFDSGQSSEFEIEWPVRDEMRIFSSHLFPEFDMNGNVKNVLGIARDITESKRADEALRQSEADLAEAQRIARIGSWSFDISSSGIRWSDELYRIFDIEKISPGITYETFLSRIHPDDRAMVLQVNTNTRSTGEPFDIEYRIITHNGLQKVIRETGYATKNSSGIVFRLCGTAQDITERTNAAEVIRENDKRFRALIENTSDGIELLDATGKIVYATPTTARMLGYTAEEYYGKNVFDLVHDDDREALLNKLIRLLDSPGKNDTAETRIRHKSGHWLWIEGVGTNMLHDPSVRAIVVNYRDITERKRAEETIRLQSARAQQLADISQALSHRLLEVQENERRMIARELHDEIGQILTAIKIDLQVIGQSGLPENLHSRIEENIVTLDRCLQQVRNLSLDLRPSVLDDLGLVAALHWQLHRQAERAGFKTQIIADDLPERLSSDLETTCFRIAQESLTNISKHAHAQHVEITFTVADNKIRMSIRDDGQGFDVNTAMGEASRGTTVGILSMRERVNLANGTLEITSIKGKGTTVQVYLPLRLPKLT